MSNSFGTSLLRAALAGCALLSAGCSSPPQHLEDDAAGIGADAWAGAEGCTSGLAFADISALSPDFAANAYGGEAGWDHVDKYAPGIGLGDLDGDGHLDIVQVRAERNRADQRSPVIYRGAGNGSFAEAVRPLWRDEDNGTFVLLFDHDGDEDLDVLLGVAGGDPQLYRNEGEFSFTPASAETGLLGVAAYAYAAVAGDVDADGDLDLYLGQWRADLPEHGAGLADNVLLLNQDGRFVASTEDLGCYGHSTLGLGMADVDGDHDLDIYVANDFFEDCLYENLGSAGWREIGRSAGIATDAMHAMGVAFGDLNADNQLDIIVTDTEQPDTSRGSAAFLRLDDGYESAALDLGLDGISTLQVDWLVSWGVAIEDFDLDGFVDVHMATHTERLELFFHNQAGTFVPAYQVIQGLADVDARGSAYGDIDGDGDLDIVLGRRRAGLQVLRNERAAEARGLQVVIEPPAMAIGATVTIETGGETGTQRQMRVIQAGSSYMSTSPAVATFGLCGAEQVDWLQVRLPDGRTLEASDVPAGVHRLRVDAR